MWCVKHDIEITTSPRRSVNVRYFCSLTNEDYGVDYWCANFEWHPSCAFMGDMPSIAEPKATCSEVNKVVIV
jgi:hypothetical protein